MNDIKDVGFPNPLESIIAMAVISVLYKFPLESVSNKYSAFELIEMLVEEIANKHVNILYKSYFDQFVDVKDIAFGDKINERYFK